MKDTGTATDGGRKMKKTTTDLFGNEITISMRGKNADTYATTICNCLYMAYESYKEKGLNATAEEVHKMWEFWYDFSDALEENNNNR